MKKIIVIAAMLLGVNVAVKAQRVHNGTNCTFIVEKFCYDATTCAITAGPSSPVTMVPGAGGLPSTPSCSGGDLTGYNVSYDLLTTGCSTSIIIGDPTGFPPATCWAPSGYLPACPGCSGTDEIDVHVEPTLGEMSFGVL